MENWNEKIEKSNLTLNWKYLVSFNDDKTVIIKKDFNNPYKEDWLKTAKFMKFFDPEVDMKYIPQKKKELYNPIEDNFSNLKFLEKSYLWKNFETEDSFTRKKDWFVISLFNKLFSWTKIHNKWEVSMFSDENGMHIYEINSTYKVDEFEDNFLLFKEFVMFSNSFLIKENMLSMFSTFTEKNISFLEWMFITGEQWISWNEKSSQFESERFWENKLKENRKLFEWTMVFWNNIRKLENGSFYWINKDMYLYYFIDDPSGKWKLLIKPYIVDDGNGWYVFKYNVIENSFWMYSEILNKIKWLKYYKDKQWSDYLFWMEYYQFNWLSFESYRTKPLVLNTEWVNENKSDLLDFELSDDLDLENI